jgi:hypothetical protein
LKFTLAIVLYAESTLMSKTKTPPTVAAIDGFEGVATEAAIDLL